MAKMLHFHLCLFTIVCLNYMNLKQKNIFMFDAIFRLYLIIIIIIILQFIFQRVLLPPGELHTYYNSDKQRTHKRFLVNKQFENPPGIVDSS